jgi:hypothetical protein
MNKKIAGLLSLIVLLIVSVYIYAAEPLRVLSAHVKFPSVIVPTITHTAIDTVSSVDRILNAKISVDFGSYTDATATAKIKYFVNGDQSTITQEPQGEGIPIRNNEEFFIQLPDFLQTATSTDYQIVVDFRDGQGTIIKTVVFPSETDFQSAILTDTVTKDVVTATGDTVTFNSGNQKYSSTKLEIAPNVLSANAQIIIKQLPVETSSPDQMAALYKVYSIPENIEIQAPITATFYYGTKTEATDFVLKYKQTETDSWKNITVSGTDLRNKTVMAYISNFGYYGIFEKSKQEDTDYRPKNRVRIKSRISTYGGFKFNNLKEGDSVKIYTVTGKKIAELTAGDSEGFEWKGRKGTNNSGDWVESGTYIYQIKVKGKVISGTIAFVW